MEFFAEWMLSPKNVVFLRVQTSVYDPLLIGDKPKWYAHQLQPIEFRVYDDGSSLGTALTSSSGIYSDENPTGGSEIWFNFMKFSNCICQINDMNLFTEWSLRGNCFWTSLNKLIDMPVNGFCVWLTDESGSDSDGAESTSSSYSSLSDYVTDMINSEIDGDTPGILSSKYAVLQKF